MSNNFPLAHPTPFHTRTAALNNANVWDLRSSFTLPRDFGDVEGEVLAARSRVAVFDISWRWRLMLEGQNVEAMLRQLLTRDPSVLVPGSALKALWLNDGGAVRGAGAIARFGRQSFLLVSAARDDTWIEDAAGLFDVSMQDRTLAEGGLALVGPYARAVLAESGLDPGLEPLSFRRMFWRGLDITLSRIGEFGGYELWCDDADGIIVWDRLMKAGAQYGIEAAGAAAADILDIETGIPRPGRDFEPATDANPSGPSVSSLGLTSLIDEDNRHFNGRASWLRRRNAGELSLVGIEIDSDEPAPFAPLFAGDTSVGHTLGSCYSPTLRRAIALAQVDPAAGEKNLALTVALPTSRSSPRSRTARARIAGLPFIKAPECLSP